MPEARVNPRAPKIVLVGSGEKTVENAKILCGQGGAIPVFVKEADAQWEYVGDFEVGRCSEDRRVIDETPGVFWAKRAPDGYLPQEILIVLICRRRIRNFAY